MEVVTNQNGSIADRINFWWLWSQNNKRQGFRSDLFGTINQTVEKPMPIMATQIKRYAKMHDLIPELMKMLDDPKIKLSAISGYHLAFLTPEQQMEIACLKVRIKEPEAQELKNMSQSNEWTKEKAIAIVNGIAPQNKMYDFSQYLKSVKKITKKSLKPELYDQADQIFSEAMELYFERHPEVKV